MDRQFRYENNKLLEINFENARCTYDTNMNRYITKKRSQGKVDMVVALINAVYLLQQDVFLDSGDFFVQVIEQEVSRWDGLIDLEKEKKQYQLKRQ